MRLVSMRLMPALLSKRGVLTAAVAFCVGPALTMACSSSSTGAGAFDAGPPDGVANTAVHGRSVRHVWTEIGAYDEPVDLSATKISAFVTRDDGTVDTYGGAGFADGSFEVAGVPDVPFSLQMDSTIFVHVAREITLSTYVVGRTDVKTLDQAASVVVHLWNLDPWPATAPRRAPFDVFTLNAGGVWELGDAFWSSLHAGDTAIVNAKVNGSLSMLAVEASRGDRSRVLQYADRASTFGTFRTLVRTLDLPTLTITDGARVEGAMSEVPPSETIALDWKGTAFTAAMASSGRGAAQTSSSLGVYVRRPMPAPFQGGTASLVAGALPNADQAVSVSFGDPFNGFEHWLSVRSSAPVALSVPDGQGHVTDVAWSTDLHQSARLTSNALGEVSPTIGPVQNVRVNGAEPFTDALQASQTPTIAWSAGVVPAGTQPRYLIDVVDLSDPNLGIVVSLWTSETSVRVPPGVLSQGRFYAAQITSTPSAGTVFASAPLDGAVIAEASFVTGVISP